MPSGDVDPPGQSGPRGLGIPSSAHDPAYRVLDFCLAAGEGAPLGPVSSFTPCQAQPRCHPSPFPSAYLGSFLVVFNDTSIDKQPDLGAPISSSACPLSSCQKVFVLYREQRTEFPVKPVFLLPVRCLFPVSSLWEWRQWGPLPGSSSCLLIGLAECWALCPSPSRQVPCMGLSLGPRTSGVFTAADPWGGPGAVGLKSGEVHYPSW